MTKKIVLISLLLGFILLLVSCNLTKKSVQWVPALDENTVYGLTKQVSDLRKNFEAFQQFQKKGQRVKANEQLNILGKGLESLENNYLPLTNAKAHLSSSYKLVLRRDIIKAKEEFNKFNQQILLVKGKATGNTLKEINSLMINVGTLEKEFELSEKKLLPLFQKIAKQLDELLNKKI